jgi:hypothetical protein
MASKVCPTCGDSFTPTANSQRYCIPEHSKDSKRVSTEQQYAKISGHWPKYFSRILKCQSGRSELDRDFLYEMLQKQDYKCALSGVEMTCILEQGTVSLTNASIDRVVVGGPYSKDNIRLVCAIVNKMRWTMDDETFVNYCKKVVKYNDKT